MTNLMTNHRILFQNYHSTCSSAATPQPHPAALAAPFHMPTRPRRSLRLLLTGLGSDLGTKHTGGLGLSGCSIHGANDVVDKHKSSANGLYLPAFCKHASLPPFLTEMKIPIIGYQTGSKCRYSAN
jgi:hypothetical protein